MSVNRDNEYKSRIIDSLKGCGIPERMHGGIIRYVMDSIRPGDFLCAVITNNLKAAFGAADDENQLIIRNYVQWFYNHAPAMCWGSEEKMARWIATKGGK